VSHTYTLNLLHVVFSTKNRAPLIRDFDGLIKNLRGIARNKDIDALAAGGTQNHVHLLLRIPPMRPVSESIRDLKANSSRYMSETSGHFAWQDGYAAISVSRRRSMPYAPTSPVRSNTMRNAPMSRRSRRCSRNQVLRTSGNISCDVAADAAQAIYGTPNTALTRRAHTIPPFGLESAPDLRSLPTR
jgi:putative transposase